MLYEVMYIIPSKFSDSEVEGIATKVGTLFEKNGAAIQKADNLGKIKLAYPIHKERYGTYMLAFIEMPGENMQKLDQDLRLSDDILRHIIVKREAVPATYKIPESYVAPLTPEGKRSLVKPGRSDAPKTAPQEAGEKLSTAELDKKLDEILESDIVSDV